MTTSWDDEGLTELVGDGGMEGLARYGLWWRVLEIVALQLKPDATSSQVRYSITKWSRLLAIRGSRVESTLLTLGVTGGVTVVREGDDVLVTFRNLLKYRDEYSRKSGHATDSLPPDTDTDQIQKQNKKKSKNSSRDKREGEDQTPATPKEETPKQEPPKPKEKPKTKTQVTNERHAAFKEHILRYWQYVNPGLDMPWDGAEGKALAMFLAASPKLTIEQFRHILHNRSISEVNNSERASKWIRNATVFAAGPIDRFGKPLKGTHGKGTGTTKGDRTIAAAHEAIENIERRARAHSNGTQPGSGAEREGPGTLRGEVVAIA
jgi:hypothetical protein